MGSPSLIKLFTQICSEVAVAACCRTKASYPFRAKGREGCLAQAYCIERIYSMRKRDSRIRDPFAGCHTFHSSERSSTSIVACKNLILASE